MTGELDGELDVMRERSLYKKLAKLAFSSKLAADRRAFVTPVSMFGCKWKQLPQTTSDLWNFAKRRSWGLAKSKFQFNEEELNDLLRRSMMATLRVTERKCQTQLKKQKMSRSKNAIH